MGRIAKWNTQLEQFNIIHEIQTAQKSQVLADFLVNLPLDNGEEVKDIPGLDEYGKELIDVLEPSSQRRWEVFVDGSRNKEGACIGITITTPIGDRMVYALRLEFEGHTNNIVEYEAVVHALRLITELGITDVRLTSDSQLSSTLKLIIINNLDNIHKILNYNTRPSALAHVGRRLPVSLLQPVYQVAAPSYHHLLTEDSRSDEQQNQFIVQRTKERQRLSQQERRRRDSNRKPKREPSRPRSLAQRERRKKENEEKMIFLNGRHYDGINSDQPTEILSPKGMQHQEQVPTRKQKAAQQLQNTHRKRQRTPSQSIKDVHTFYVDENNTLTIQGDQRKRTSTQSETLKREKTNTNVDTIYPAENNALQMERNHHANAIVDMHTEPANSENSIATDIEMSIPATYSSDEYTDYYDSSDEKLDDDTQTRKPEYSTILRAGKLFQEFLVDSWASTEQSRLDFLRFNQGKPRADQYAEIKEMKNAGLKPNQGGKPCILPSSFTGGPRHMFEIYQDSMAITRFNHHPDIFLTMTANPNWPEIKDELSKHEYASDRPDLVARVFELKRKALMDEIIKKKVFGEVVGHVHTIEFQKRGLLHMHALIFLQKSEKIRPVEQVDKFVSAEFPDEGTDPVLFDTVRKCMVHGPCGDRNPESPCMRKGNCIRGYPKQYNNATCVDGGGYPVYRRRDDGREVIVRNKRKAYNIDVVPYNPHLTRMFNCHINVEVCAGVRAVKYIHKYIYKGHDRTTVIVGAKDEVQEYIDARYVGPPEAAWRLFGYSMHQEVPSVQRLAIHLPGQQRVVYESEQSMEAVSEKADSFKTTLMGHFEYYAENPNAPKHTYQDFPQHFVWLKKEKRWKIRQQGFAIARIHFVSPNAGELYYLRLLLTVVAGADSFRSLRTVDNEEHPTFKKACIALGILENDKEYLECLTEAAVIQTGSQMRKLFKIILWECNPAEPEVLWAKFGMNICDDLPHAMKRLFNIQNPTTEQTLDYGLYLVDKLLRESGKKLEDYRPMPTPKENWGKIVGNFNLQFMNLQFKTISKY
ncbi:uncharacterized protein LOC113296553 [Papaver somniferum]|uniref:uncharacterized protein LOC113296553 n=1 Tax=Papaver somniferum TaxID=3469 RepID=UPI000E6F86AC|nr:uncharacterized protein LOC113296553 [Papaver somniferum]